MKNIVINRTNVVNNLNLVGEPVNARLKEFNQVKGTGAIGKVSAQQYNVALHGTFYKPVRVQALRPNRGRW